MHHDEFENVIDRVAVCCLRLLFSLIQRGRADAVVSRPATFIDEFDDILVVQFIRHFDGQLARRLPFQRGDLSLQIFEQGSTLFAEKCGVRRRGFGEDRDPIDRSGFGRSDLDGDFFGFVIGGQTELLGGSAVELRQRQRKHRLDRTGVVRDDEKSKQLERHVQHRRDGQIGFDVFRRVVPRTSSSVP